MYRSLISKAQRCGIYTMARKLADLFFLAIFSKCIINAEKTSEVDKRLLLDDPQTATSQLMSLQREIQTLQTKIAEIDVHQSQIQFLNAQVSQLQQENTALKQQISHGNSNHDVQILTDKMATIETKVDAVVQENHNLIQHSGSTYFPIWGRKSCPTINGTELVYTGITAGKHVAQTGSGTNTLCVPHDPDSLPSDFPTTTYSSRAAELYGAEYQFTYKNVAVNDDVPCAICKVKPATATMMVPAKLSCPQGWTLQYNGYLSSSYYSEQATDFICVDSDPEFFEGLRQVNSDGHLIYPVRSFCGALPCPNYKSAKYLACAICTL